MDSVTESILAGVRRIVCAQAHDQQQQQQQHDDALPVPLLSWRNYDDDALIWAPAADTANAASRRELAAADRELAASQRELAAADRELAASQRELAAADRELAASQRELAVSQQLSSALAEVQRFCVGDAGGNALTEPTAAAAQQLADQLRQLLLLAAAAPDRDQAPVACKRRRASQ